MDLNFVSIGGTTKFKFCGPEDVVPHNFTQFFHTNFCGTTFMFLLHLIFLISNKHPREREAA